MRDKRFFYILVFMPHLPSVSSQSVVLFSLGGSLVVPETGIDTGFLKSFKKFIEEQTAQGKQFVIVVGGGHTARTYQAVAGKVAGLEKEDLDWLGIHSTRLNGHLMRTILRKIAHPVMVKDPTKIPLKWKGKVLVLAGWKPGWSTDYVATYAGKQLGAKTIINLSNIDQVYTGDPRKMKTAKPLEEITWKEFRKMVGNTWDPGMNVPFDPVASKLAQKEQMTVIIANGKKMGNLKKIMEGKPFLGTVIR